MLLQSRRSPLPTTPLLPLYYAMLACRYFSPRLLLFIITFHCHYRRLFSAAAAMAASFHIFHDNICHCFIRHIIIAVDMLRHAHAADDCRLHVSLICRRLSAIFSRHGYRHRHYYCHFRQVHWRLLLSPSPARHIRVSLALLPAAWCIAITLLRHYWSLFDTPLITPHIRLAVDYTDIALFARHAASIAYTMLPWPFQPWLNIARHYFATLRRQHAIHTISLHICCHYAIFTMLATPDMPLLRHAMPRHTLCCCHMLAYAFFFFTAFLLSRLLIHACHIRRHTPCCHTLRQLFITTLFWHILLHRHIVMICDITLKRCHCCYYGARHITLLRWLNTLLFHLPYAAMPPSSAMINSRIYHHAPSPPLRWCCRRKLPHAAIAAAGFIG